MTAPHNDTDTNPDTPDTHTDLDTVRTELQRLRSLDVPTHGGSTFAYVYDSGRPDVDGLGLEALAMFGESNGLDPTAFPSLLAMERDLVAMAGEFTRAPAGFVGTVTSGLLSPTLGHPVALALLAPFSADDYRRVYREVLAAEASWLETTVHELSAVSADRRERKSQAQYAVDYARESVGYQRIVKRIEQAQLLGKDVEDARNRLAANPLDRRALQTIAVAEQRYEKAQARFSALAATLKLERLGFSDVLVDGRNIGEEPVDVVAGNGTVIEVPGAVRIEVMQRGESADAAAEVKAAHTALLTACRDAGAADVADDRQRLATNFFDLLCRGVDGAVELGMGLGGLGEQRDVRPVARGTQGDREADTSIASGDEHGASGGGLVRHDGTFRGGAGAAGKPTLVSRPHSILTGL